MDLYEPGRTLIHSGPLVRKIREEWSGWTDLQVALLDNFSKHCPIIFQIPKRSLYTLSAADPRGGSS